ncbi:MAG: hypothetical protein H6R09_881 [Proteobacteria bacterium]|nr:hypothetical protein [Pseudomonadota bacterium]
MIDFDALVAKSVGQVGQMAESVPPVPVKTASVPLQVGQAEASNSKDYRGFFASVPVVPPKNQWTGNDTEKIAGAGGAPQQFRAELSEKGIAQNEANPAAVLLLMAWARVKQATREERAAMLLDLEILPPADQVRHWHGVCLDAGLKPWHVLCLPAPRSGDDCTLCKHLTTRHEAIGEDRRRYHWACDLGYLILEHGRGTERVYVAPPECQSFERWYPSQWR